MLSFTWATFTVTVDFTDSGDDVTTIRPVNNASCYYLSDIEEKYCDFNPVRTASECHEAAKFLNATIVQQGCGRMPESCKLQGCVSDKKTDPGNHLVFWNGEHNDHQNSSDPKIRRICRGKEETLEKRQMDCNRIFSIKFLSFIGKILRIISKCIF